MVENGFALGSRGEKSAVCGESCLCEPPRKKVAWENCRRPVPSCTCDHHCPAPLQLTLIIEQRRRVEERVGLCGFHPLSPLASSPLAQSRGLGKSRGAPGLRAHGVAEKSLLFHKTWMLCRESPHPPLQQPQGGCCLYTGPKLGSPSWIQVGRPLVGAQLTPRGFRCEDWGGGS